MADIIYILNGKEVSASKLEGLARALGISVQEFKDRNNVTVKEGGDEDTGQVSTQPSAFSQIIDGKSPEDFQEVAVTKGVPAVTEKENTPRKEDPDWSRVQEINGELRDPSNLFQETDRAYTAEEVTSGLELQLEDALSVLNGIEDGGIFGKNYRKKSAAKIKVDNIKSRLADIGQNAKMDIDNPYSIVNKGEKEVEAFLTEQYDGLVVKRTGVRNALDIYFPGADEPTELDLQPIDVFSREGENEAVDVLKALDKAYKAQDNKALVENGMIGLVNMSEVTNSTETLNAALKGTGYNVELNDDSGTLMADDGGILSGFGNMYDIFKDGQLVKDVNPAELREWIATEIPDETRGIIAANSYKGNSEYLEAVTVAIEKESKVIQSDKSLDLKYFKDNFAEDLIEILGDELTEEEKEIIRNYNGVKGERETYMSKGGEYRELPATLETRLQEIKDLSGLPESIGIKIYNAGSNQLIKGIRQKGIKELKAEELSNRSKTISQRIMASRDKNFIRFAQGLAGIEKNAFNAELKKEIESFTEVQQGFQDSFDAEFKKQANNSPQGTTISLEFTPSGQSIIDISNDRKDLTEQEKQQLKQLKSNMYRLQGDYTNLQVDRSATINDMQQRIVDFEVNNPYDSQVLKTSMVEYGLGSLIRKDVNDSFAGLLLAIPTLANADWAIDQQRRLDAKNDYYETMGSYNDGDFLTYALRSVSQQSGNITLAIATGGAGSAMGLSSAMTANAIGGVFGISSGTQTYRDLKTRQQIKGTADKQAKIALEAYESGTIDLARYTRAMKDINQAKAMYELSDDQILNASLANGIIEGTVTRFLGTAPNTIKLLKDFKSPTNVTSIARNLYKNGYEKVADLIGKPLLLRGSGEVFEEELIYGGQQFITEYGILGRDLDLSAWDDTAMATVLTLGVSQAPGVAYSGMVNYNATKKFEQEINSLRMSNNELSTLIQSSKISESQKKLLINDITKNLEEQGLEVDKLGVHILGLQADDVKRLVATETLKRDVLLQAGVVPGMNDVDRAEAINLHKESLSKEEAKLFDTQLSVLDKQIKDLKDKPTSTKKAKESLGSLWTNNDKYLEKTNKDGYNEKSTEEKLVAVINQVRESVGRASKKSAKANPEVVEMVESETINGKPLNKKQKEVRYRELGDQMALNRSRAISVASGVSTRAETIFADLDNVNYAVYTTEDELREVLEANGVETNTPEFTEAVEKFNNNGTYGAVIGNTIVTQDADQAKKDIDNGIIQAGTVIFHEFSHIADDASIKPENRKMYAENLAAAAAKSKNRTIQGIDAGVRRMLDNLYNKNEDGESVDDKDKLTFENSEKYRDEYTKVMQESLYAYEDEVKIEKEDGLMTRVFNATDPNNLNTPEKALEYLAANNAAFRSGKISKKTKKAIKNFKGKNVKFSEKNSANRLALEYKKDPKAFMAGKDYTDLFVQFQSIALSAMGYNVNKGDIVPLSISQDVSTEFDAIMKSYKPVDKDGNKRAFTTYVTSAFKMGRGNKFYKKQLAPKEGRTTMTDAAANKLLSTDTAESGLDLEERRAKEAEASIKKRTIDPRKLPLVSRNINAIEKAVDVKPEKVPTATFKSISDDYSTIVASKIYDVKEDKLGKDSNNLTYADKIVDGRLVKSELGQLQQDFKTIDSTKRILKLLPEYNIVTPESTVDESGERIPTSRDLSGTSLGIANKVLDFFYENYVDPRAKSKDSETKKSAITNPSGRSKGLSSQGQVKRLKPEFIGDISNDTVKKVQEEFAEINKDFAGIKDLKARRKAIRDVGQKLKGWGNLVGSIVANTVVDQRISKMDLATAKPKKQIRADVRGGRSKVQFSEVGRARDLANKMEEIAKTSRLLDSPIHRSTIKMMNADGIFTVADMKNKIGIKPKPGDELKNIKKSGYRVLSGQLDVAASILNKFLETNPRHYKILKESLTNGTRVGLFGTVEVWSKMINLTPEIKNEIKRDNYTTNKKQKPGFVKETSKPDFVKDQYAKLGYFESFWKDVETFLKEGDNMSYAWVWQELLVDTVDNMKGLNRIAPPVLYLALDKNGNIDYDSGIREEHNFPSNNVGTLMLWAAMNGEMENTMKVVSAAYMQGPILLTDDRRIDATSVQGQFSKDHYKFAKKISGGLSVNMPDFFWKTVVPRILSGDLIIPEGLGAVPRLSAANVNLDSYKFLPEDMTMSEYFFGTNGVPTETKLKGVATQDQIIKEFFSGEITLKEARAKGKQAVAVIKKLEESFKPEAPVTIEFNNAADKAMANARDSRKYKESARKARVFDFDDTLAQSNSMVIVNKPNPEGGFSEGTTKLKAIFMVGGPGAGKTNVGKGLQLGRRGYKVVNQDIALEAMKSDANLPGDESGYTAEQRSTRSKLGFAARKAATAKFDKYAAAGNGMVIDGTGASYSATTKKIKELQDKGFEVHMVVANTPLETALERNKARKERSLPDFVVRKTYDQVQESLARYKQDFGGRLYEINTENIQYGKPLPKDFLDQVYAGINSTKVERINATEFALEAGNLEQQGATFNFSEFSKVIDGKKGPLFDVAKFISEAEGQRDMFVLTARPADSAPAIKEFLDGLGLNIPIENIVGLGDGKAQAKADWFTKKYSEGYNDFYFADDALKNVKAVKDIFNVLDVKSQVQQARVKFSEKMSTEFNDMIERNKGVKSQATFSDVQARRRGTKQKKYTFFIPPSADDFRGLTMYTFAGKGKQGEADQEFFDKALIKPYQAGVAAINRAKFRIRTDYGALVKNNKKIAKRLKNEVAGTNHTLDEAIRVYLWNKEGYDIPGMSKRDVDALVGHVESGKNGELIAYAEGVKLVTRKDAFPPPTEFWDGSTILGDLNGIATDTNRAEFLKEFIDNSKIIFSPENLNKVEAVYGFRVRESIENILFRMETGQNKAKGSGRIVNGWNDWVNNSVGAIMFFNRRSALMQTLSTVNFVNWSDNNPIKAAAAFANQPQYWKDFITLWSSPKLVARRKGLESDIQEAEIARAAKKGGAKGVISYLLKIGFTPTQLADSFAIASGGATFYRNRVNSYLKEQAPDKELTKQNRKMTYGPKYTKEQAEQKAFEDFSSIAEETQQSGDPMLVSQQQASVLGRLVLAFQNTPMQYTRLIKKSGQDLINRRGNPMTHVSKIVYYGFVQNLIFSTLQNALFALIPGFDDEEEDFDTDKEREKYLEKQKRKEDGKVVRVANSMIDTLLRGSGLAGAVVSTIKNVIMAYQKYDEAPMIQKENADIILAALNISPPIGSKARKINNVLQTMQFEKDVLAERGFSVMIDGHFQLSPAYDMLGDLTSATLNLPLDRVADEVNAITEALDTRNTQWQRIALALGWRQWDVGARAEEHDLIKTEAKAKRKVEGKEKAKETRAKNKIKKYNASMTRIRVLRNVPENIKKEIKSKEKTTGFTTPVYRLKELAEEYNIDISKYE